ncbi:hypothetical protein [Paenibacillus sp. 453mf]|uniref:hypothetical protein n=1 Tax=Paenibacillus sp. 453mf TaxID=1761874 RepID=UPI0008F231A3|nr:hypothetical protein [Paenibacillus sp. 453mf]SFS58990.1 hypothetical protein SAMN04488601_1012236 [Paenibacillus sp. 453mf]
MFQHLFAEMNQSLDEIANYYTAAPVEKKQEMRQRWNLLKKMSDGIIDEWMSFEEKMAKIRESGIFRGTDPFTSIPELKLHAFVKGLGYFKLLMYQHAAEEFGKVVAVYPESLLSRLYLAMCYLNLEQMHTASEELNRILLTCDQPRMKAMAYNALGCVHAKQMELKQAQSCFALALEHDPSLPEPLYNLEACRSKNAVLQYGTQLLALS